MSQLHIIAKNASEFQPFFSYVFSLKSFNHVLVAQHGQYANQIHASSFTQFYSAKSSRSDDDDHDIVEIAFRAFRVGKPNHASFIRKTRILLVDCEQRRACDLWMDEHRLEAIVSCVPHFSCRVFFKLGFLRPRAHSF